MPETTGCYSVYFGHGVDSVHVLVRHASWVAQVSIDLIETLFEDWYIAREARKRRFAGPLAIAQAKKDEKQKLIQEQKSKALPPPSP